MFPFYSRNTPLDERDQLADRIHDVIGGIDPRALDHDGFWATFVDDLANGDLATEDVLDSR